MSAPRTPTRQRRPDPGDTRDRILAAAGQVFARKGFRVASLDEVARAAGLTKGAIYWHFSSKNDLFFALLDHKFAQNTAPVPAELRAAATTGDPRLALATLLKASLARLRADPDWPPLLLEFISQARDNELRTRLAAFRAASLDLATGYIAILQDAGLAPRESDARALARFWTTLFDGILLGWIVDPAQDPDALVEEIVDLLRHGIVPAAPANTITPAAPAS